MLEIFFPKKKDAESDPMGRQNQRGTQKGVPPLRKNAKIVIFYAIILFQILNFTIYLITVNE